MSNPSVCCDLFHHGTLLFFIDDEFITCYIITLENAVENDPRCGTTATFTAEPVSLCRTVGVLQWWVFQHNMQDDQMQCVHTKVHDGNSGWRVCAKYLTTCRISALVEGSWVSWDSSLKICLVFSPLTILHKWTPNFCTIHRIFSSRLIGHW